MSALLSQSGMQPEVPGYKPPEAFLAPKSPDLSQESREGAGTRISPNEKLRTEEAGVAAAKAEILSQAEKLKSTGEVAPSEVDAHTRALLEDLMTGKIGLDQVDKFDPDAVTRGLMN